MRGRGGAGISTLRDPTAAGVTVGAALRGVVAGVGFSAGRDSVGSGGGHVAAEGVFGLARTGLTPPGVGGGAGTVVDAVAMCRSSPQLTAAPTAMSPPHTEQRARIATLVIFAGSSRKTDRHSGQETFIGSASLAASGNQPLAESA